MDRFIHGRVIFAGDAAHQVSPFGARGANSGLEDAENLAWKLDRCSPASPETLLDSYHVERSAAADENIRESTRSTDFMAPNSPTRRRGCARRCCRSPRKPNSASAWSMAGGCRRLRSTRRRCRPPTRCMARRSAARRVDARCACRDRAWRTAVPDRGLHQAGIRFHAAGVRQWRGRCCARRCRENPHRRRRRLADPDGLAAARYDAEPGTAYLLRPDGYVAARFRHPARPALDAALARASGYI